MTHELRKTAGDSIRIDKTTGTASRVGGDASAVSPVTFSPKRLAIAMRIRELLKMNSAPRADKCFDEQDFAYKKYARKIVKEHTNYETRRGLYFGLSVVDRARLFWDRMERICNQSNAIAGLPPWWVK